MFSGQGSQYFHMGQVLYEQQPVFRRWMQRLDTMACDLSGHSVVDNLYSADRTKSEVFEQIRLTHPAIFMVEYALARTLIEAGVTPDVTLGASMGSFAAAAVAGCMTVEEALTAVIRQAEILEASCRKGGMLAILADVNLYQEDVLRNNSEIASHNFASHFVVSAPYDRFEPIEAFLRKMGVPFQRLPVTFAFHSRWIDEVESPLQSHFSSLKHQPATIPIACCAHTQIIQALPENYFWTMARKPIEFRKTIEHLESHGHYRYIDVGPAGTLATFLRYILPPTSASKMQSILTPFGRDMANLAAVTSSAGSTASFAS